MLIEDDDVIQTFTADRADDARLKLLGGDFLKCRFGIRESAA